MATLSSFGIPGVGNTLLHPKLKNKWRVTFSGLATGTGHKNVSMAATTITRPQLEFEEVAVHRYNSTAYVAGKHSWSPANLTIEDDIAGTATRVIKSQLDKQQHLIGVNVDGRTMPASGNWLSTGATGSDYKFAVVLEQLDGDETVVEKWVLEGVMIQSADFGDLDYSASEAATIQLTLRFDHARSSDPASDATYGRAGGAGVGTGPDA